MYTITLATKRRAAIRAGTPDFDDDGRSTTTAGQSARNPAAARRSYSGADVEVGEDDRTGRDGETVHVSANTRG